MKNSNESFFDTEESTPEPVSTTVTREKSNYESYDCLYYLC